MNSNKIYSTSRTVVSKEIDELNHVNNVVYVQWVQDVAKMHWEELTKYVSGNNYIWVVLKHEIDYKNQAALGDVVTLKTWVGETAGVKSVRHVDIYKDDILLVTAKTTWCLLNSKTFKPTRITENITNLLLQQ
ncbi:thioesterase [Tenacibaculum sp. SZ-18]|uniref:acyl-CoA thioesterase n=1 Tax=Tenacibaculum sp. SZ-18 TaxID=754423 RepID=UPI000C2D47D0|nr:thioesterase family protein [Tenacibaculum sp. SZ-18]AUC14985.1 thioesterase [Tenacibaculum sp. SZ-18]